ncbi:Fc.00g066470.m01.CDS01 [Cosmosporella sp. VM-42]
MSPRHRYQHRRSTNKGHRDTSYQHASKALPEEDSTHTSGGHYIRSWLAQIVDPSIDPALDAVRRAEDEPRDGVSSWHPYNLPLVGIDRNTRPETTRKRHLARSDSSIVTSSAGTRSHRQQRKPHHNVPPNRGQGRTAAQVQDANSQNSIRSTSRESIFEKRPRRKTRESRYEPKNDTAGAHSRNKKSRSRPKKNKKRPLSSSRNIMINFASDAIPNKRLTMKPSLTTGLFLNGRTSTANQLADLTFNDMVFLGRREEKKEEHKRDGSPSQQKPRSRKLKDVDQDGEFFAPLRGKRTQTPRAVRSSQTPEGTIAQAQIISTQHPVSNVHAQLESSSDQGLSGQGVCVQESVEKDATHRAGREITYISWSSSDRPQSPEPQTPVRLASATTTPRSIRQALVDTGVFDHTGILAHEVARYQKKKRGKEFSGNPEENTGVEETMQQYIERIEMEALAKSENPYRGSEDDHFRGEESVSSQKLEDALLDDASLEVYISRNPECPRPQSTAEVFQKQTERTASAGHGPAYVEQLHPHSGSWSRHPQSVYVAEDGSEGLQMTTFWRPNRFM